MIQLLLSTAYTAWGVAGRERRLPAARRNTWAGVMLYRDSVSLTPLIRVFRGSPLALWPLKSRVICTLSWVLDWQSCEVSKPFDPLLLDMMMDALCFYYFSDLGVGDHVSSGLVDSFP